MNPTDSQPTDVIDPEKVRFSLERDLAAKLNALPAMQLRRDALVPKDSEKIRRRILAEALRLTPSMAPAAFEQAEVAKRALGLAGEIEIYQSSGRENAVLHLVEKPIMLEVQGRMLSLLDQGAGEALFGHELGHYIAHGPWTDLGATAVAAMLLAESGLLIGEQIELALKLSVAREVTADRFGLLACRDLNAALRLEMIATTGLSGNALTWDTAAYLEQCRELMEGALASGEGALSTTHPEHSLRAWAVWLFSETEVYRELTGSGPATRKLSEVDQQIAAVLGVRGVETALDVRDEPPSFLLECALASAVLVAQADGDVAPEELAAIEDAFSQTVPGWSELLDVEVALERFYETGHLVRDGGADLARRLFLLLVHVMGADDVVEDSEVEMILSIGEALGYRREFVSWLEPALRAMGASRDVAMVEPKPIPLPTRKKDVDGAFDALCDMVDRRRETRISVRRLCRLSGSEAVEPAALKKLETQLRRRKIIAEPVLSEADPDDRILLTATAKPAPTKKENVELSADREGIIGALSRLRDELVTGDGRSPSVRVRRLRKGRTFDLFRLEGVFTGAAERVLTLLQTGKAATLVSAADAGKHDVAHACSDELRALDRTNRDRREETGANDLYLGYPLVIGSIGPRKSRGPAYGVRAPLVLTPIELHRDGRGARGFSVKPRADEPPFINQSLLRVLFNKAQLAMPDELTQQLDEHAADPAAGVPRILDRLREVGLHIKSSGGSLVQFEPRNDELDGDERFVEVEDCALLGIFPQSSSDLLHDYGDLLRDLGQPDKPLGDILSAGEGLLPLALRTESSASNQATDNRWPVVAADPSQRVVASECRKNVITVVDGPPGTGKSQLIVNLVADALGRGEKVAVVAEKRAAIDVVFQRLDARGLGESAALVHDVNDDRKPLFAKIARRIGGFEPREFSAAALKAAETDYQSAAGRLRRLAMAMERKVDAASLTVGQLMVVASGGEDAITVESAKDLTRARLDEVLELVERLRSLIGVWSPSCWWRSRPGPRRPLHELEDAGVTALVDQIRSAAERSRILDSMLAEHPTTGIANAGRGLEAYRAAISAGAIAEDRSLLAALIKRPECSTEELAGLCNEHEQALVAWPETADWEITDDFARSVAVLKSFAGRWTRVFSLLWWKTRGGVRRALVHLWPENAATALSRAFLGQVSDRISATKVLRAARALADDLGVRSPSTAPQLTAWIDRTAELKPIATALLQQQSQLAAVGLEVDDELFDRVPLLEVRERQWNAHCDLSEVTRELNSVFSWVHDSGTAEIEELLVRFQRDVHRLREADARFEQLDRLYPDGRKMLDQLAVALPDGGVTEWREAVARAWASAHLATTEVLDPALRQAGTVAADQEVERAAQVLAKSTDSLSDLEVERILARLDDAELLQTPSAEYRARRTPEQKAKERILKEVSKSRSLMPLRRFVREFASDGVLDVLPCWLLSPETMAVLFPREPLFDLVIFDEASQCTVEAGFPVMTRAKRVVVAGDEKQMPPSSYFALSSSSTDEEDRSDEELAARDIFSGESLLSLARTRCPHAGLEWHYRCRQEELIAFSNHSMYAGELMTIPSVSSNEPTSSLKWVNVPDGAYDAGLNRPEAGRVVDLLKELLSRPTMPTVGVVTFNLKQRQTILDLVDDRIATDSCFAELWRKANAAASLDERPFVKNLESVQGDEREIIIFSLGHAPVQRRRKGGAAELYVPARFGPLGQKGGERRLNVAISRAKAECFIVSSFDPKLLHVGNSKHDGPRLFKGFLTYAHHMSKGQLSQANRILDDVRGVSIAKTSMRNQKPLVDGYLALRKQISLALEDRGFSCAIDVGTSGFKIPLAVGRNGSSPSLAVLTIEGDTQLSPFARFVHEPSVLGLRGWNVMHVSAASWLRRQSEVLREIEKRI